MMKKLKQLLRRLPPAGLAALRREIERGSPRLCRGEAYYWLRGRIRAADFVGYALWRAYPTKSIHELNAKHEAATSGLEEVLQWYDQVPLEESVPLILQCMEDELRRPDGRPFFG